ncbi:MAG: SCO family protein [Betaproteobacteria bacterium]|nr:SCO family protein [Betaproteobacteria bacterium]
MKSLLSAAGVTGGLLLASTICWAHAGHDHGAQAKPAREARAGDYRTHAGHAEVKSGAYSRSLQVYLVPDVALVNADAKPVRLRDMLGADAPVMVDFISTTRTTTSPTMSAAFSKLLGKLKPEGRKLRMISVSVDPENDKPAQLKAYAKQFGAGANWQFLTGNAEDIETLLHAFDNYHRDMNDYGPLTLLRPAPGKPWVRIDGFASADELARELRTLMSN